MKRTKIIAASLLIMISLTGCSLFPTGENYSWGDKEAEVTVDDNNNASGKLNESIAINAEINEPDNVVWKEYSISQVEFSEKELDEIADPDERDEEIGYKSINDAIDEGSLGEKFDRALKNPLEESCKGATGWAAHNNLGRLSERRLDFKKMVGKGFLD